MKERPILFSGPMVRALLDGASGSESMRTDQCRRAWWKNYVARLNRPTLKWRFRRMRLRRMKRGR